MRNRITSIVLALTLVLIIGLIGCGGEELPEITEYTLTISSTEGGSVTSPGEPGPYSYNEREVVSLVAEAEEGYEFVSWTGEVDEIADAEDATTTVTMKDDYSITANFAVKQYDLNIGSTEGGSVSIPGEGTFTYEEGEVVNLVAEIEEGYQFMKWTGSTGAIADVYAAETTITMNRNCYITANFAKGICDWYDLNAIRDNLDGSYVLMNDLDSTTAGYSELASETANGGKGWQPVGSLSADPSLVWDIEPVQSFTGMLDGQGYEIRNLFIDRPEEEGVGLFGFVDEEGVIENVGVASGEVIGGFHVGGLVGWNDGIVKNVYSSGTVIGNSDTGGLVGWNNEGTVSASYSSGSVSGTKRIGGLLGWNSGTVRDSYSSGSVTGESVVGGLVGSIWGWGTVSNSYYSYDEVLINGRNIITIGALSDEDFDQWLANDKFLDVNERLFQEDAYYIISDVSDFKQLLAFGQDDSLRFRLKDDLDLRNEPNFYIPYLAGEFDGNGHRISNVSLNLGSVGQVGLFGHLVSGASVTQLGVENANISASGEVGGLVGFGAGTINNSYVVGSVNGVWSVGGLVGVLCDGAMRNSYFSGSLTAQWGAVGGLVGRNDHGTVNNSYYNYDQVLINQGHMITVGALFGEDFCQWLSDGKFLDVNERFYQEDGYYVVNNVSDFKQLLAFGQDDSLRFRLKDDLDLRNEPNFYIPYLAGEFDGNGHKILNLSFNLDSAWNVGLFGYLAAGGRLIHTGIENAKVTGTGCIGGLVGHAIWNSSVSKSYVSGSMIGYERVGGLVGWNDGTVSNSYSGGSVTGQTFIGGLAGVSWGNVNNAYSSGSVSGDYAVGGLIGGNWDPARVRDSYSSGSVNGDIRVGGLVGINHGVVSNSFWDVETSGMEESDSVTGKTTTEMKNIATFSGAGWSIIAVSNPDTRSHSYIWNIVDGQTYPFLSWQSVS